MAPVSKSAEMFFGPSVVSRVTVHSNLENIQGWYIREFVRERFITFSSWTGSNRLFGIVRDLSYFSSKFRIMKSPKPNWVFVGSNG
jgi:hypothetical protein